MPLPDMGIEYTVIHRSEMIREVSLPEDVVDEARISTSSMVDGPTNKQIISKRVIQEATVYLKLQRRLRTPRAPFRM